MNYITIKYPTNFFLKFNHHCIGFSLCTNTLPEMYENFIAFNTFVECLQFEGGQVCIL